MKLGKYIYVLLVLAFSLAGCQIGKHENSETLPIEGENYELILNNRLSLPTPEAHGKILPSEELIIFSSSENSVGYRWVDKEEIEFVGSNKSSYDFFNSALNNPTTKEEMRFIEGLGNIVDRSFISSNNIEFYLFDLGDRQKIYILSSSLEFVTEVTSERDLKNLFEIIVQHSYIQ